MDSTLRRRPADVLRLLRPADKEGAGMIQTDKRSPDTAIDTRDIPMIGHPEAMQLAETECERMVDLVHRLEDTDWGRPTDCTEWSVKDIVVHQLGEAAAIGSIREMVHQLRAARRLPPTRARG